MRFVSCLGAVFLHRTDAQHVIVEFASGIEIGTGG